MKAIIVTFKTQQPLLATSFQGDPNSDVSYSYIRGSMIRGAVIRRYLQHTGLKTLDLTDAKVQQLFFDADRTRYLNAYLLSQEQKRTLPLPLSWFKDKDAKLEENTSLPVYDFSRDRDNEPETPKSLGDYFWAKERGGTKLYNEKRRINIHNFRDRKKGRSTKNQGKIFQYDALDAGQSFQSVILCEDEDAKTIEDLLTEPNIWFGGCQSAGYGHCKIIDVHPKDDWNEIGVAEDEREDNEILSLTLLSDTLLRDRFGQPSANPALIKDAIEDLLNMPLPQPRNVYTASTLIGGFNLKWGLPLPQLPALKAGSIITFEDVELSAEQIQLIEALGIGERREDGFGRIAVTAQTEASFSASLPDWDRASTMPSVKEDTSLQLAQQMAEKIVRRKLELSLQKKLEYLTVQGEITNSQLSRLELVARKGLASGSRLPVFKLLRYLPSNARKQFQQAKLSGKPFDRQICEWLRHPESWVSKPQDLEVNVAGETKGLSHRLAREYTLRLIMAVAKKATKEERS